MGKDGPSTSNQGSNGEKSPLSSELQLVRILDRTLKSRYPEGVSLLKTLEGGLLIELHRRIRQPFSPHACAQASELTEYLWQVGRVPFIEPGGGITIRGPRSSDPKKKFVVGRAFFKDAEIEYRMIHTMIADALRSEE